MIDSSSQLCHGKRPGKTLSGQAGSGMPAMANGSTHRGAPKRTYSVRQMGSEWVLYRLHDGADALCCAIACQLFV